VQPGEPYRKGVQLTEQQADALLRKDLRKYCALFRDYGSDSTLVAVLAYNCGPRKVTQSSIARKLRAGERDIYHDYLSFCRYKGKMHQGIRRRRWVEFQLLYE
jgi:GH24 family phage-related lysozyme (muramidase)